MMATTVIVAAFFLEFLEFLDVVGDDATLVDVAVAVAVAAVVVVHWRCYFVSLSVIDLFVAALPVENIVVDYDENFAVAVVAAGFVSLVV